VPIEGLDRALQSLRDAVPDEQRATEIAHDAADHAASLITQRVEQHGRDRHGRPFKPYAKSTKEQREKRGRQVSFVDLNDSGEMFAAMRTKALGKGRAMIYFSDPEQARKAAAHQYGVKRRKTKKGKKSKKGKGKKVLRGIVQAITGRRVLPKREFFGLTKQEQKEVMALIKDAIRRGRG